MKIIFSYDERAIGDKSVFDVACAAKEHCPKNIARQLSKTSPNMRTCHECLHLMIQILASKKIRMNMTPRISLSVRDAGTKHQHGRDFDLLHSNNFHHSDFIMSAMASQITSVSIVCSTVCSGVDQRKHQRPGLCEGNPPVTDGFPWQMASNAENVSIWWRHLVEISSCYYHDGNGWNNKQITSVIDSNTNKKIPKPDFQGSYFITLKCLTVIQLFVLRREVVILKPTATILIKNREASPDALNGGALRAAVRITSF